VTSTGATTPGPDQARDEHVRTAQDGSVLTLVFDRPEKKNALTNAMYGAWADALAHAASTPDIRCVVITGAGGAFTAGNDLGDFAAVASGTLDHADRNVHRVLRLLASFPKPIVAAVPGVAVGIGTTLLLHSDVVILARSARLSAPFVDLALVPEAASSLLLPQRIGYGRSYALFALGETIDAPTALAWGLAHRVVEDADLAEAAQSVARRLAGKPAGALAATKRLMRAGAAIASQMEAEGAEFAERLRTPEAREAFQAFAERRKPDFTRF
jgi:enoyl-CoA hydratase/carnithine racemase